MIGKLIKYIKEKIKNYKRKKMIKKRMEELKKRDPFVYNHQSLFFEINYIYYCMIYWFTGQPGAGKTTLAKHLTEYFPKDRVIHIDGDDLRDIFKNKDYSITGRRLNIQRAQYIAQFMHSKEYTVIVSLVSPYRDQREEFKFNTSVVEIYVHTTEDRGRNQFHVEEYEPPLENFIDIDTTIKNETDSYYELLKKLSL